MRGSGNGAKLSGEMSDPRRHELYDDGRIALDERGLAIRRYYPWGSKRIPYTAIRGVTTLPLTGMSKLRRWRIWGSGDFVHWWNLDPDRPGKDVALVIELDRWIRPTITPDDPEAVKRLLTQNLSERASREAP